MTGLNYVIVGAGSAGSVVANRLSENVFDHILLLEAGGDENEISDIPGLVHYLQLSDLDWKYKTEPQANACLGYTGNRCNWPRGKVLGGSSVLNYMLYVRGNRRDYDNWESMGNAGWGYDDVLPYFKKSEDNKNPYLARNKPPWRTPIAELYVRAGVELGYPNVDYNSRSQREKERDVPRQKPFLRPANKRKNLHVAKHSFVTKILIDPDTRKVRGVRLHRYGKIYNIFARKEVIVSAGPLTVLGGLEGVGFVDTIYAEEPEWPDIEFHLLTGTFASDGGRQLRKTIGFTERSWRAVYLPIAFRDAINIFPKLLRPASRGTIRLRSRNPFIKPLIDPNILTQLDIQD
ncbi:Glucose dehydrogenase [FAD, quinone] [Armadillidium nasatum]|uniref:Glucose dehydrogenase [FAD, quinone] n=1 Tax=Armadillidium nasatum TaxID=96803 RepID=A0A5N5SYS0_9CRUS|nr:Glucose dehydrogenase [FAD, quinone] [Armadillidium nasatum]